MADVRQDFSFPANPTIIPPDVRAATALEFIAHYLDRIEGHLEKLAGSVASTSGGMPAAVVQLQSLSQLVENLARGQ